MAFRLSRSAAAVALVLYVFAPSVPARAFSTDWPQPPSVEFGELYRAVEMAGLFADQKTFADAAPRAPPDRGHGGLRSGQGFAGVRSQGLRRSSFQLAAPGFPGLPAPARRGRPRLCPRVLAGARAQARRDRAVVVAAAARSPLCRPGRPLPRDLLLGQLFHHARAFARRPPRPRPRHARQFRLADRPLRPHPQRQSQLLPEPLAAAVLLADGRIDRRGERRRGPLQIPAGARGRIRLLDGRLGEPRARRRLPPRRPAARRRSPQSVLGRSRRAARRILSRGCRDGGQGEPSGRGGVPRSQGRG